MYFGNNLIYSYKDFVIFVKTNFLQMGKKPSQKKINKMMAAILVCSCWYLAGCITCRHVNHSSFSQ
ncbi:YneF family protein [Neobacillus cucumis]|uniref:YneF family protein n=1 Tax=Neobacillus cucumis TaxID=1740721 RepID=UPI0035A87533